MVLGRPYQRGARVQTRIQCREDVRQATYAARPSDLADHILDEVASLRHSLGTSDALLASLRAICGVIVIGACPLTASRYSRVFRGVDLPGVAEQMATADDGKADRATRASGTAGW